MVCSQLRTYFEELQQDGLDFEVSQEEFYCAR
jgi:hypothetical protein